MQFRALLKLFKNCFHRFMERLKRLKSWDDWLYHHGGTVRLSDGTKRTAGAA